MWEDVWSGCVGVCLCGDVRVWIVIQKYVSDDKYNLVLKFWSFEIFKSRFFRPKKTIKKLENLKTSKLKNLLITTIITVLYWKL